MRIENTDGPMTLRDKPSLNRLGTVESPPGAAAGEPTDRSVILQTLRERILRFAASRLSRDVAEDLTQDVLLLLTTKYAEVSSIEDLLPLAFRILRFKIQGHRRKAFRRGETKAPSMDEIPEPTGDAGVSGEQLAQRRELSRRLQQALKGLSGRCRTLFLLKIEGHGFGEIQLALGAASINTVYTWDARCRSRLRELMGGSWE